MVDLYNNVSKRMMTIMITGCYANDCYSLFISEPMASSVKATLFIFILYRLSSAQDNSTTCDIPWVEPLANTSITCHFPINVNQTSTIFGVSFESNDREKKIQGILDCGWFSGKMRCSTNRPGYKYNDIIHVSNTFSLEIPQASIEHIGRYTCHLVDIGHDNFKPCEFKVKVVGKTMCLISSVESKTRTSLTCYYPEDLNKTRMNFTVYHYSRTGLADVIMACEWNGDNLTCNTSHGYEFDGRVSDYLTLKIPMALESQEGAYSCHISVTGFLHYDNCTLEKMTSTCHISSVEEAKPTALTCKFSVDVNMTKRNFTVVRLSDTDREAAVIASCTWLRNHLTCTTAVGYQLNNTVTDHVIISLPQASHNHSGTYACHVTGTVSSGFEPCELIIMPVSDKSFLSGFITAAIVIVMCIPLSLIIVIFVLRKNTSHINKRLHEEANVVSEITPMIPDEDGERDQKACEDLIVQEMVMIQEETVDTKQKASQDHSPIQSDGHEEEMNQTSPQSGICDKDTQPPSNEDQKSPLKSGPRRDRMSVMSPQNEKGSRRRDVATDDNQDALRGMKTIRVVLVGKTGSGKSSLGNTLLGKKAFKTSRPFNSCTEKCQWGEAPVGETLLKVTDTPGLWDTQKLNNKDVLLEIGKSFSLCAPGPHVVIIVLRCDVKFTKEEQDTVTTLQEVFGDNLSKHLMVVFTRGDSLRVPIGDMQNALKEKLRKGIALNDFLRSLNNRYCVVANTGSREDLKIHSNFILNMVQNLMEENKGACFTNKMIAKCNENVQRLVQERERAERLPREEAESKTMEAIATGTERPGFFETLLKMITAVVAPVIEAVITRVAPKVCSVM